MKVFRWPIKTTIVGGLVFLVPVVIVIVVLAKAFQIMSKLVSPMSAWIPLDSIGGIAIATLMPILALLLLCFVAGLIARSAFGGKVSHSLESKLDALLPRYAFIKSMTEGLSGESEEQKGLKPVLAQFDDYSQIAFEVERNAEGLVTVYLPGAPDPWSGSVVCVNAERIKPLDAGFMKVIQRLRRVGVDSGAILTKNNQNESEEK